MIKTGNKHNKQQETFNMFWHGDLTPLELSCIQSFINHGHSVRVFTYQKVALPNGAINEDASQILPYTRFFMFEDSPSAFSNIFRYKLLLEQGGWWVDTDVVCLKGDIPECDYFWAEEIPGIIASSVLKFPAGDSMCERLFQLSVERSKNLTRWGQLGPLLVTEVLGGEKLSNHLGRTELAYPINYDETHFFWLPEFASTVEARISQSLFLHLWHNVFKKMGIDLRSAPPAGSFLRQLYVGSGQNIPSQTGDIKSTRRSIYRYLIRGSMELNIIPDNIKGDRGQDEFIQTVVHSLAVEINELEQKLVTKDKDINRLNNEIAEINKELAIKKQELVGIKHSNAWNLRVLLHRVWKAIALLGSFHSRMLEKFMSYRAINKNIALTTSESKEPDVTVVIPVYNKGRYLQACLESVLRQTGITFEVICVDDCSTDGSWEITVEMSKKEPLLRVVKNESNRGASYSRNVGISMARGRYLQFTDADDLLLPGSLATLLEAAERTGADVVRGTLQRLINGVGVSSPEETIKEAQTGILSDLQELWIPWWHYCFLISHELLVREDIKYPDLIAGEDPVFMARVLTKADRICVIPQATYIYRPNDSRPQPNLRTVADYITHAQIVQTIYAGDYDACWRKYRDFIISDIRLLLSQAYVTPDEFQVLDKQIHAL